MFLGPEWPACMGLHSFSVTPNALRTWRAWLIHLSWVGGRSIRVRTIDADHRCLARHGFMGWCWSSDDDTDLLCGWWLIVRLMNQMICHIGWTNASSIMMCRHLCVLTCAYILRTCLITKYSLSSDASFELLASANACDVEAQFSEHTQAQAQACMPVETRSWQTHVECTFSVFLQCFRITEHLAARHSIC